MATGKRPASNKSKNDNACARSKLTVEQQRELLEEIRDHTLVEWHALATTGQSGGKAYVNYNNACASLDNLDNRLARRAALDAQEAMPARITFSFATVNPYDVFKAEDAL